MSPKIGLYRFIDLMCTQYLWNLNLRILNISYLMPASPILVHLILGWIQFQGPIYGVLLLSVVVAPWCQSYLGNETMAGLGVSGSQEDQCIEWCSKSAREASSKRNFVALEEQCDQVSFLPVSPCKGNEGANLLTFSFLLGLQGAKAKLQCHVMNGENFKQRYLVTSVSSSYLTWDSARLLLDKGSCFRAWST